MRTTQPVSRARRSATARCKIVEQVPAHERAVDLAGAPLRVRIRRTRPDRRGIRRLLDQERPAGLGGVLARHVERHHRDDLTRACRVVLDPLLAAANLVEPHERERALRRRNQRRWRSPRGSPAPRRAACRRRWRYRWRPAPARARRARRARRRARRQGSRRRASGSVRGETSSRCRRARAPARPRARRAAGRAARGVALKPNERRRFVVRNAAPLQDVRRRLRPRVAREVGGDHAGGAAIANGAGPQLADRARRRGRRAPLTSLPVEVRRRVPRPTSTSGSTTPPARRRERVDAQRHAVLLAREHDFARCALDRQRAALRCPSLSRARMIRSTLRRDPSAAAPVASGSRSCDWSTRSRSTVVARVPGEPPQRRHERERLPWPRCASTRGAIALIDRFGPRRQHAIERRQMQRCASWRERGDASAARRATNIASRHERHGDCPRAEIVRSTMIHVMSRKSIDKKPGCALCGAKEVTEPRGEERYCRDCWDKKIAVEEIVAREFALKRYIRAHSAEKYLVYHSTQKRPCGQLIVVDDGFDLFLSMVALSELLVGRSGLSPRRRSRRPHLRRAARRRRRHRSHRAVGRRQVAPRSVPVGHRRSRRTGTARCDGRLSQPTGQLVCYNSASGGLLMKRLGSVDSGHGTWCGAVGWTGSRRQEAAAQAGRAGAR